MHELHERFGGLVERFKAKNREELLATGVLPEQSQLDLALEEIVQKMDETELATETNENNANEKRSKEMEQAKDLREMACETLGGNLKTKIRGKWPSWKKEKK